MHWSNFHLCMPGWHIMLFSSFSSNSSSRSSSMAVAMFSTPNATTDMSTKKENHQIDQNLKRYLNGKLKLSDFIMFICLCVFVHLLTFSCLAHGSGVSTTLAFVIHPKRPHFTVFGQNTCVSLTHGNLSYKMTFEVCHLTCREENNIEYKDFREWAILLGTNFNYCRALIKPDKGMLKYLCSVSVNSQVLSLYIASLPNM